MRDKQRTVAELAGRQHGVVSARQLEELGYSRSATARGAASGRLHRVHRGVYAVGHRSLSWHAHQMAAVLACAPNAVLSHRSAASLWGLARGRPDAIHVTAPTRKHPKASIHFHFATLTDEDRDVQDGIPLTALPRTLLDMAATLRPARLDRLIERAEELRLFDLGGVEELIVRAGSHGGVARLRRAIRLYRQEPAVTRSPLERRFLDLVREAGLPAPSMNHFVEGHEVDAYWPEERFAVELDGYRFHRSRAAFERDRLRQEELKLAGVEMIRVTARRIADEPREVIGRIAALLKQRRREVR